MIKLAVGKKGSKTEGMSNRSIMVYGCDAGNASNIGALILRMAFGAHYLYYT